jgi:hypothetical protein
MKIRGWKEMMVPEKGEKETQVRNRRRKSGGEEAERNTGNLLVTKAYIRNKL